MFEHIVGELKKRGLILEGDVVIAGMEAPSAASGMFGAVGAAVAMAKCKRYIISANTDYIRVFDVDKKYNSYLNTYSNINKANIQRAKVSSAFGSKGIMIKADFGTVKINSGNKFQGYKQKEAVAEFTNLIKTNYPK